MTYDEALTKMDSMSTDDVAEQIHPYVQRGINDNDAKYLRKMLLFLMVANEQRQSD